MEGHVERDLRRRAPGPDLYPPDAYGLRQFPMEHYPMPMFPHGGDQSYRDGRGETL